MGDETGLSSMQLLKAVYDRLGTAVEPISLPEVYTIMADDSDGHRIRRGNFAYRETKFLEVGGTRWAIAVGTKCGSYPGREFAGDLIGFRIVHDPSAKEPVVTRLLSRCFVWVNEVNAETLADAVFRGIDRNGDWFAHTILCGMSNGDLRVHPRSSFPNRDLATFLQDQKANYIAQPVEHQAGLITGSGRPVVSSAARYRPEFADILAEQVERAMSSLSSDKQKK
jgi:hypothetical protein